MTEPKDTNLSYWEIVFKDMHKEIYANIKWEKTITKAVVIGLLFVLLSQFVRIVFIPTTSMSPTIPRYGVVLLDAHVEVSEIETGDVIAFHHDTSTLPYIKRVIATPGDTLEVYEGHIKVNGSLIDEPYVKDTSHFMIDFEPFVVPEGKFYVLGDNRANSYDSRSYGYIEASSMIGKMKWNVANIFR